MSGIEGNRYCGKLWANKLDTEDAENAVIYGTAGYIAEWSVQQREIHFGQGIAGTNIQ